MLVFLLEGYVLSQHMAVGVFDSLEAARQMAVAIYGDTLVWEDKDPLVLNDVHRATRSDTPDTSNHFEVMIYPTELNAIINSSLPKWHDLLANSDAFCREDNERHK